MQYVLNVSEHWASLRSHPEGAEGEDPPAAEPSRAADFSVAGYRTRRDDPPCRLSAQMEGHFLEKFPKVTGTKKDKPYRPCRVCQRQAEAKGAKRKGNRQETRFYCKRCMIPLHHYPCFEIYHTKKDFAKDKREYNPKD